MIRFSVMQKHAEGIDRHDYADTLQELEALIGATFAADVRSLPAGSFVEKGNLRHRTSIRVEVVEFMEAR